MPSFGNTSNRRLRTAHTVLQTLAVRVVRRRDVAIIEGHRDQAKQILYFQNGTSKVEWPNSRHNSLPAMAIDMVGWPEVFDKKTSPAAFMEIREIVLEEWGMMEKEHLTGGYKLRHGADWDMDGDTTDQTFMDWPHWELIKPKG